jgi:parvulin-like peptidyl-prolyl isomerase
VRIDSSARSSSVAARGNAGRATGAGGFFVDMGDGAAKAAPAQASGATTSIGALLALQAADDPLASRRKAVRHGRSILDTLEAMKADLLLGRVSEERLGQLMRLIADARERTVPGLDAILDDIELRARVELAKFGRFPA